MTKMRVAVAVGRAWRCRRRRACQLRQIARGSAGLVHVQRVPGSESDGVVVASVVCNVRDFSNRVGGVSANGALKQNQVAGANSGASGGSVDTG